MSAGMTPQLSGGESFVLVDKQSTMASRYFPEAANPVSASSWSSWTNERAQAADRRRKARPDGKLYIDELLKLLGVKQYPPASPEQLAVLLDQLERAAPPATRLTVNCAILYLLLSSEPERADEFAKEALIPAGYVVAIKAFVALDSGDWSTGVALLTDGRLSPDFVPKTLRTLGACVEPAKDRSALVLQYWRLVASTALLCPERDDIEVVLVALAESDSPFAVQEAAQLARAWTPPEHRQHLWTAFLAACFGANYKSLPSALHLKAIITWPLDADEQAIVSDFCARPPKTLSKEQHMLAAEWRLSKLVAEGRSVEAIEFARKASVRSDHPLLKAVEATLTEFERVALDLDIEDDPTAKGTTIDAAAFKQPGWAPTPRQETRLPKSLKDLESAANVAPSPKLSAAELPLSASPFLRAGKELAGPHGAPSPQKTVLRAMREASLQPSSLSSSGMRTADKLTMPASSPRHQVLDRTRFGSPAGSASPSGASRSAREASPLLQSSAAHASSPSRQAAVDFWSADAAPPGSPSRKPVTLAGFGSVRVASSAPVTILRSRVDNDDDDDDDDEQHERDDDVDMDDNFASRAVRDPAIAQTIQAAHSDASNRKAADATNDQPRQKKRELARSTASAKAKTEDRSKGGQGRAKGDSSKRRALSKEPDDGRPRVQSEHSMTTMVTDDDDDDDDDDEDDLLNVSAGTPGAFPGAATPSRRRQAGPAGTIRKTLANRNEGGALETPRAAKTKAKAPSPPTSAVRRSSRLASSNTPARASAGRQKTEEPLSTSKNNKARTTTTTAQRSRRGRSTSVLTEEDDD